MKKLTLILSTVLLMSSTAAFAKSKTRNLNIDMVNKSQCALAKTALDQIAIMDRDVSFAGKCSGKNLVGRLKLVYNFSPTQKYKITVRGVDSPSLNKATAEALGMVFGKDVSISAKYNHYLHYIWISGEISLK